MNKIKTVILLGLLTALIVFIGRLIEGRSGMIIVLLLGAAMNFFFYWYSDKIMLAMYRARPLDPTSGGGVYQLVAELTQRAGLPMPRLFVIDDDPPNAFATGHDPEHAVVAVTSGIMRIFSPRELRGVLAHELAHVKDRDILINSVATILAGAVMVLADLTRFGAIFGGMCGNDEEGDGGGYAGRGGPGGGPSWRRWRPCSSRWPSAARANTWPTKRVGS